MCYGASNVKVFYHMLAGASAEERAKWRLPSAAPKAYGRPHMTI
jgi:hypothetical protein